VEKGITRNQIVSVLSKSPHGALAEYVPVGTQAAQEQPEFLAHLIAWNRLKGSIRDAKVALPVVSLTESGFRSMEDYRENSLAHLALLDPRNFLRAMKFSREVKAPSHVMRRLVTRYLRFKEQNFKAWERAALQHRASMHELYAYFHVKPSPMAELILFQGKYPKGTLFDIVASLKDMTPAEAAGHILEHKLPFLIVVGALGVKAKEPDLVLAMIERMSPTELVTNTKMLERLGVKTVPALRAAFEQALGKAAGSKKATFKTTRAVQVLQESDSDEGLQSKLQALQEKQIKALGGIDGNWLVLGDKSGSMSETIEVSRIMAATLARMVKGQVHMVFFDTTPYYYEATGKTYEEILEKTRRITAGGGTSIGCGLRYIIDKGFDIDGIAIASDGGENTHPYFATEYEAYQKRFDKEPTVYLYHTDGDSSDALSGSCKEADIDLQVFDLTAGTDYAALPNIVATMRVGRYALADEILNVPLVTLNEVLPMREASTVTA
jgi:hypothetical protein